MCRDKFISLLVNQINVEATNSSCKDILSSINNLQEIKIIDNSLLRNPDEFSFADVLFGLVPLSLQSLIRSLMETTEETDCVLHVVMEKFSTHIYKNIWVKRYNEVKSWEIINGIKNKKKRKIGPIVVINSASVTSTDNSLLRNPDEFSFADVLFGLVPLSLQSLIRSLMETTEETDCVLHVVMEKFSTHIYKNIWVKRYNEVKSWEIINGIKNKKKRKIGPIVVINSASVTSTGVVNNDKISRDKRFLKNVVRQDLNMLRVAVAIRR
ncbi:hypothetical protein Glove_365g19 [Diversispora epigaea]|uniref:Uncharacterized protein n=1 Tax=Diversispora epigaea TaxID=1348612 RepID=A0A397HC04_9GLOM|nr:hypothetical protein Glove_365g19 [Diversispora epigaea]